MGEGERGERGEVGRGRGGERERGKGGKVGRRRGGEGDLRPNTLPPTKGWEALVLEYCPERLAACLVSVVNLVHGYGGGMAESVAIG